MFDKAGNGGDILFKGPLSSKVDRTSYFGSRVLDSIYRRLCRMLLRTTRLNKLFAPTTKTFYDVQVFHNDLDFLSQKWSHQFELGKLEGSDKKAERSFIRVHDDVYKSFLIQHLESHFYE